MIKVRRVNVVLIWHFMAIAIYLLSLYALYTVIATSITSGEGYDVIGFLPNLLLLITAIGFNYALNLWTLSISTYRVSLYAGLILLSIALYMHNDIALLITLLTAGFPPMLSSLIAILTRYSDVLKRVEIVLRSLVLLLLVVVVVVSVITIIFTLYKPEVPIFMGRDVALPSGDIVKADEVLKAYLETGGRRILVTDYGGIPVKSVIRIGEEVEIDTYRGVVNILYEFFEILRKTGEHLIESEINIDVIGSEVSILETVAARVYPYIRSLIYIFPTVFLHILRLVYGLLLIAIAMVVKR